ncbi:MAG TPA: S8 family serine peptidase [Terriglobales bacterium]|nr:S8 family serine peptidase [Terriglobales bacterium]
MVASRAIVKFKTPPSANTLTRVRSNSIASRLAALGNSGWYVVDSRSKSAADLIAVLQQDPAVDQAAGDVIGWAAGRGRHTLNRRARLSPLFTDVIPNDPGFPDEWDLRNTGQTINGVTGVDGADIDVEGAWSRSQQILGSKAGTPTAIAVFDSGIAYGLSDLSENMWSAPSAYTISIQGNVYDCPEGSHGFSAVDFTSGCSGQENEAWSHGTQVASVIGAIGNNSEGMVGEAWATEMLSIRIFDANGLTSETTVQTGIDALLQIMNTFGTQAPVGVINMSITFGGPTPGLESSIQEAAAHGIVTAAATGNECGPSADYPALYRTTGEIAVSGSDQLDEPMFFSDSDCSNPGGQVAAPGKNIEAIAPGGTFAPNFGGTSASTPLVSAAAAILMSQCPLSPNAVVNTLAGTAREITNLNSIADAGQRLDLGAALASCLDVGENSNGQGSLSVDLEPGDGIYATTGEINVTIDGITYSSSYDTSSDNTESIAEGLAGAISGRYVDANDNGDGTVSLSSQAKGSFTNYSVSVAVTKHCNGPAPECDPAPTVHGQSFTGGTGPTRPQ